MDINFKISFLIHFQIPNTESTTPFKPEKKRIDGINKTPMQCDFLTSRKTHNSPIEVEVKAISKP